MGAYILVNVVALFSLNLLFLVFGSFLNAAVLFCFWKSSHLRKKLCHFTILVLSFIDLACVIFIHPMIILSTVSWHFENSAIREKLDNLKHIKSSLYALSFYALMTMNLERYIAIKYPIYHRTAMTKAKLMLAFATLFLFAVTLRVLSGTALVPAQLPSSITFTVILAIMLLINFKMYIISKRTRQRKMRHAGSADGKVENSRENNTKQSQLKSDEKSEESNKLEARSSKLEAKSNNLHVESNKSHQENRKLQEESNKSQVEAIEVHTERNTLDQNKKELQEKNGKLYDKSDNLHEEKDKPRGKNSKLQEKSSKPDANTNNVSEKRESLQKVYFKTRNKLPKLRIQNISTCILAVACFTVCSLPGMIFNALNISMGKEWFGTNNFQLTLLWVQTFITMNSSFNTLVFFWKNKILRKEGIKAFRNLTNKTNRRSLKRYQT